MSRPRLLDVGAGRWLVVATAPLDRYGADAINRRLSDLEWVARAAIAHEAVVESFIAASAVLPMKLFTIFAGDDRAADHVRSQQRRIDAMIRRVANHHEWGVRITLDGRQSGSAPTRVKRVSPRSAGRTYLAGKKARRDEAAELANRARDTVADVYDRLALHATRAQRRAASDLPIQGGPLLMDAAFLVPVKRSARFRGLAVRQSRAVARHGYRLVLTGPWPPYTFVRE